MPRAPKTGEVAVTQIAAFPEPDRTPEHAARSRYHNLRDNNPFLGVPDPHPGLQREDKGGEGVGETDHDPRCVVPSHQQWALDWDREHGVPVARDFSDGSGCAF